MTSSFAGGRGSGGSMMSAPYRPFSMCFLSGVAWQWYRCMPYGCASNSYVNEPPGGTISNTPSMLAGWIPWKWIVCGCEPWFRNSTRKMSPSVARRTGPGTVPLYVHAAYVTPCATSISRSSATSRYSRTRPGCCGSGGGGMSSASRAFGPPGAGTLRADHRRVADACVVVADVRRRRGAGVAPACARELRERHGGYRNRRSGRAASAGSGV